MKRFSDVGVIGSVWILFAVGSKALSGATADEMTKLNVPPKPARSVFDMREFSDFINYDLSTPKSEGPLVSEGRAVRVIQGQLVDHLGKPIADAQVTVTDRIGYDMYCYDENFDKTDKLGRFLLQAEGLKDRVVLRRGKGQVWNVYLKPGQTTVKVVWPKPSSVTLQIAPEVCKPGSAVHVYSAEYWAGRSPLQRQAVLGSDGTVTIVDMLPSKFRVSRKKTITVSGIDASSYVDIGEFVVAEGQDQRVILQAPEGCMLEGRVNALATILRMSGTRGAYIAIERQRTRYQDIWGTADIVACNADGQFACRALRPGLYLLRVRYVPPPAPGGGFGGGVPHRPTIKRRIAIGKEDEVKRVELPLEEKTTADFVHRTLDSEPMGSWSHTDMRVAMLVRHQDRQSVAAELFRILNYPESPQEWKYPAIQALGKMTETKGVVDGLLGLLELPYRSRSRGSVLRALQNSKTDVEKIIGRAALICQDEDPGLRFTAYMVLGRMVDKNPQIKARVVPILLTGLTDDFERLRADLAATLGRIDAEGAEKELTQRLSDPNAKVRLWASWSIWKITGKRQPAIETMTELLSHEDFDVRKHAALALDGFDTLPPATLAVLRENAKFESKGPFRNHHEVLRHQVGSIAARLLKKHGAHVGPHPE